MFLKACGETAVSQCPADGKRLKNGQVMKTICRNKNMLKKYSVEEELI